jgi:hypothetical protein
MYTNDYLIINHHKINTKEERTKNKHETGVKVNARFAISNTNTLRKRRQVYGCEKIGEAELERHKKKRRSRLVKKARSRGLRKHDLREGIT